MKKALLVLVFLMAIAMANDFDSTLLDDRIEEIEEVSSEVDLLIITPNEFLNALIPLKNHKDRTDISTEILTLESIYDSFSGRDEAEKVKKAIFYYVQNHNVKWVMLVGDCDKFPVRYVKAYNTEWGVKYYPSDLYYADLYDSRGNFDDWDYDNDNAFGEMDFNGFKEKDLGKLNLDRIDMYPDVMVGRIPASTFNEVSTYVNKIISYEYNSYNSEWFKKAFWVIDCDFGNAAKKNRLDNYLQGFKIIKSYSNNRWCSMQKNARASIVTSTINSGVGFVNYFGHGSRTSWLNVYDKSDLNSLSNSDKLPVIYAVACYTGRFHFDLNYYCDVNGNEWNSNAKNRPMPKSVQPSKYDKESLAEEFLVKRSTGAIAYIGCTSKHEYGGEDIDKYFFEAYKNSYKPPTLGYLWKYALDSWLKNVDLTDHFAFIHMHKVMLFGDPSLRVGGISRIQKQDFVGTYDMDHDGWKGVLELRAAIDDPVEKTPNIVGKYFINGKVHDVYGYVKTWRYDLPNWVDHKIEFYIDFNDTPTTDDDQKFVGFLHTQTKDAISGITYWHGTPFGFYAIKR